MKNKTFLPSTLAVLILLLSGCGDKGTGALDDPAIESETKSTITSVEKNAIT